LLRITMQRDMKAGEVLQLYSPIDAQFYMGVSETTLNRYRKERYFDPSKLLEIGRGYLYTKEALDEALINLGKDREEINVIRIREVTNGKPEGN